MRRVLVFRSARRLGPAEASGAKPRLPELVLGTQQRVARKIGGSPGNASFDTRTARDEERVVHQMLGDEPGIAAAAVANARVDVVTTEIDQRGRGPDVEVD